MKSCTIAVSLITLLLTSPLFAEKPTDRYQPVADRLIKAINDKDYPRISQDFDQVMLNALPLEKSKPFFQGLTTQFGSISKLGTPRMESGYIVVYPVHFERGILDMRIVLNDRNKITGLWFLPHKPELPVPEQNTTALRLPFKEQWTVIWGGDTKELNQHHDTQNQRYAFDFVITDAQGQSHKNDGLKNEDYYAFGQEILAPADGIVTDVIRGVRDNAPGSMNPYSALGNAVIIKQKDSEVSVLAHFKQGSIRVNPGDTVKQGQLLGLCGNSGNSSEPHLHYHLQNTEIIQDGTGIKCVFDKILVIKDGKEMSPKHHAPEKGEIIQQL